MKILSLTRLLQTVVITSSAALAAFTFQAAAATPAEGVTTFNSLYGGSFVALTGSAKSAGGAGLVAANVAGYDFRLRAATSTADCGIGIEPLTGETALVYGYTESGGTTLTAMEVTANDGKYFDLRSVGITMDGPDSGVTQTMRLVGYRDGNPVGGAVLSKSVTAASWGGVLVNFDVSANSSFVGISMFRIETDGSYTISGAIGVDNVNAINFRAANTSPTVAANTGSTAGEGGKDTITVTELDFNDAEQADTAITYTIGALPTHGLLLLNGALLAVNGTFTQSDINNSRIVYAHDGSDTTSDSFSFSVNDGAGGLVTGQMFAFAVTPVNDANALSSPVTITFTSAPGGSLALDGLGGSSDIAGIAIGVYFADNSLNRINNAITFEDPYAVGTANSGLAINYNTSAGSRYVVIKSQSAGDNFWLQSLQLTDYGGNNVKVEAFDNGVSVGFVNLTVNADPWYFTFDQNGALNPAIFANVDEVRISGQDSGTIWLTVNDIRIAAPISNQAPTDIALSNSSAAQSGGVNAVIGTLSTTDQDSGDTHIYSLVSGTGSTDNGSFNISGNSLRANNASALAGAVYSVRIQTDDGNGGTFAKAFNVTIVDDVAPVITSNSNASGTNGTAFNYTIMATGGAISFGGYNLPGGLSVNSLTGEISGTPTQAGLFNALITASDAAGNSDTNSLSIIVAKASAAVTLLNLTQSYDGTSRVVASGTTPDALSVTVTYDGSLSAPTNAGTYEVIGIVNDPDYAGAATNTLTISKAALSAVADNQARAYGQSNPTLTGTLSGAVASDNLSVTYSTTATASSPAGDYDIVPSMLDPLGRLANYDLTVTNGTLTVTLIQPAITLSAASTFVTIGDAPAPLDSSAQFIGSGLSSLNGATLTLNSVSNAGPDDLLSVVSVGNGSGEIGVTGQAISFGGLPIATYTGGTTGLTSIQITFNSSANEAAIQALLRQVSFSITTNEVTNVMRAIEFAFDDGAGATSAPVTLQVTLNYRPLPYQDRIATGTNIPVHVSFIRMLTNDVDVDGAALSVIAVATNSANGGIVVADGTGATYTPAVGFSGVDQLFYTVSDGRTGTAVGVVNVYVLLEGGLAIEDASSEPAATNNSVALAVMGIPGRTYRILASENLFQWTQIGTVIAPENGFVRFFDADAPIHQYRFYRTVYP